MYVVCTYSVGPSDVFYGLNMIGPAIFVFFLFFVFFASFLSSNYLVI